MLSVFFDLDDTLYEQQQPFAAAIQTVLPDFPKQKMAELFLRFRYRSDEHYEKTISGVWSLTKMRRVRVQEALSDVAEPAVNDQLADEIQAAYDKALLQITLPIEIKRSLTFLKKQGVQLGVITNGPTKRQTAKLTALELARWIPENHWLISNALGVQKPAREIFAAAEKLSGKTPPQLLYIGDSFPTDIIGATQAGWHAIWFNHRKRTLPKDAPAFDYEVQSFAELEKLLTTLFAS